jgi:RimJ/RimL family protein N-acetyltransferase
MLTFGRVTLRGLRRDDLPRLWAFNNDVDVELAGGGAPPIPQSLDRLVADFDQDASRGGRDGARFAIEADGRFIGQCAIFNYNDYALTAEIGITIGDEDYLGKGYGREALHALLHYGFVLRNIRKLFLTVNATNERAIRAYQSCGFVLEGRWRGQTWNDGRYVDLLCMGVFAPEWNAARDAYFAKLQATQQGVPPAPDAPNTANA